MKERHVVRYQGQEIEVDYSVAREKVDSGQYLYVGAHIVNDEFVHNYILLER